ncbi:MAG: hypothetical protein ACRDNL_13530 [Spirillospora sp.]
MGGFVAASGSGSGATYFPYVGSASGVAADVWDDGRAVSGFCPAGSSRSPNASSEASTTGVTKAPAMTPIRLARDGRSPTSSPAG